MAAILGRHAHDLRPHLAVFDEQARLQIVAAAHPLIVACALGGRAFVALVGRRPGEADLARLLHQLEDRIVLDPR